MGSSCDIGIEILPSKILSTITNNFISRLLQCGHLLKDLIPILQCAASTIDNSKKGLPEHSTKNELDKTLYIHWQFHPKDINKAEIRQSYSKTLKGYDNFNQMRIAMSPEQNSRQFMSHKHSSHIKP